MLHRPAQAERFLRGAGLREMLRNRTGVVWGDVVNRTGVLLVGNTLDNF